MPAPESECGTGISMAFSNGQSFKKSFKINFITTQRKKHQV